MPLRTEEGVSVVMARKVTASRQAAGIRGANRVRGAHTGELPGVEGDPVCWVAMRRLIRPRPVLFLCLFVSQAALLVLSPVLPEVARDLGVSTATAGQLRSLSGLTGGVTAVLLALAPRRPGLRRLLSAGAALVASGSALSVAAPSFALLAVAQGVTGIGVGLLVAVGIAAAWEWPPVAERPSVLAWAIAGMPVAWIAGMPLVGALADISWRAAFLVPVLAASAAVAILRRRPADPPTPRARLGRDLAIARFTVGELLANAAWASVLTYSGALLLDSYDLAPAVAALGLGAMAAAMVPATFLARRHAARATPALLAFLTTLQAGLVVVLGTVRPAALFTVLVLAAMAFVNGWRSMVASALGMDAAPHDRVAVMSMRAAANQFGYLLGAAAGGLALAVAGFAGLGIALGCLFVGSVLVHLPALLPGGPRVAAEGAS